MGSFSSFLLDIRMDVTDLKHDIPDLANEFAALSDELDASENQKEIGNTPSGLDKASIWESKAKDAETSIQVSASSSPKSVLSPVTRVSQLPSHQRSSWILLIPIRSWSSMSARTGAMQSLFKERT